MRLKTPTTKGKMGVYPAPTLPPSPKLLTLTDLVNDYIKPKGKRAWRITYGNCLLLKKGAPVSTLKLPNDPITISVYGLHWDSKRNLFVPMDGHQRRIAGSLPSIIKELKRRQQRKVKPLTFSTFEDLFDFVANVASAVRSNTPNFKFGPLANYDIAGRLAVVLQATGPKDIIYFQAGALDGIKNLYKNASLPLPRKVRAGVANLTIYYNSLIAIPKFSPLSKLTADEIEDFCCIYSDLLKTIKLP